MALIHWLGEESARSQFERANNEFDRMLALFRPLVNPAVWSGTGAGVYPPINVYDDHESFIVRAELPGVERY